MAGITPEECNRLAQPQPDVAAHLQHRLLREAFLVRVDDRGDRLFFARAVDDLQHVRLLALPLPRAVRLPVREAVEARRHLVVEELLELGGGDHGVIGLGRAEVERVALVLLIEDQAAACGEDEERDRGEATHAARMPPCAPQSQRSSSFSSRSPPSPPRTSTKPRATPWPRGIFPRSPWPWCRTARSRSSRPTASKRSASPSRSRSTRSSRSARPRRPSPRRRCA